MANWNLKDKTAVVGVGNSVYGRRLGRSAVELVADALRNALDDCGLGKDDVDAGIVSVGSPLGVDIDTLASFLGLNLRCYLQTWSHGRFTASCLQWAALVLEAGFANAVACVSGYSFPIVRGSVFGGTRDREGAREGGGAHGQSPAYGMTTPGAGAAMLARRYFERYGATSRQLAAIPVAFRKHASLNPNAIRRDPITVEDHQRSRMVIDPLHLLDFCQVTDGACCLILTSAERARDMRKPPVYIAGMQPLQTGREEFIWGYPGLGVAQQEVFDYQAGLQPVYQMAGVTHKDIDALFVYDAFSITAWTSLERMGFCKPGEAADFTQNGRIELGGELPINTNGGLLSEAHINAYNHQVEIVRQLRGECGPRQVADAQLIQWATPFGDSLIYRR